jgi:hypothetical protein
MRGLLSMLSSWRGKQALPGGAKDSSSRGSGLSGSNPSGSRGSGNDARRPVLPELDTRSSEARSAVTFRSHGVDDDAIERYLDTPEGTRYWLDVRAAYPLASPALVDARAFDQLRTGSDLPRMLTVDHPLVKIVPRGGSFDDYRFSPFFVTGGAPEDAIARGYELSDHFALPIRSQAQVYDIYEIRTAGPTEVFVHTIAPTSELQGRVARAGGATQYIVQRRDQDNAAEG